jgi:hypothetical protein
MITKILKAGSKEILLILIIFISPQIIFSQAGDDKVICKGYGTIIGPDGPDPGSCYSWSPETGLDNPKIANPKASPQATTTYTLTITSPNFESKNTDDMTVYVVDNLELKVENDITECMEKRVITYTAILTPDYSDKLDGSIEFKFYYEKANGTKWNDVNISWDFEEDNTAIADDVLDGDNDHKFETPIYAEAKIGDGKLTSNTLQITVYELWIDYVRHDASKTWKAVVGEPFEYNAIASSDCKNWNWDMEDGFPDTWNPTGGNQKKGNMSIPVSDLPDDDDWDYFGEKYGTVNVQCQDDENNNFKISSNDITPSIKASIFFDGTLSNHPGGFSKNWFYYWKYALFGDQNINWKANLEYGECYNTGTIYVGELGNTDYATPYDHYQRFNYHRPTADGKSHIDLFYSIVTHELKHLELFPLLTTDRNLDTDGDFIPDTIDPFPTLINGAGLSEYVGIHAVEGDLEYLARSVENVTAPSDKDWSKNGKQW